MRRSPLAHLLLVLALLLGASAATAQTTGVDDLRFEYRVAGWNYTLDSVQRALDLDEFGGESLDDLHNRSQEVLKATAAASAEAQAEVSRVGLLLDALGPAPEVESGEDEEPRIAQERRQLREQLSRVQAQQKQAELSRARAQQLIDRISATRRNLLTEALLERGPSPLAPGLLATAASDLVAIVTGVLTAPSTTWMPALASEDADQVRTRALSGAVLMAVLLFAAWRIRSWLLVRYVRDRHVADPGYRLKVKAALAAAVARGGVPALLTGLPLLLLVGDGVGLLADTLIGGLTAALLVTAVYSLGRAVLAPYSPPAWRLAPLDDRIALLLFRRTVTLAAILGVAYFLEYPVVRHFEVSQELVVAFNFVVDVAVAAYLALLAQPALWRRLETAEAEERIEETADTTTRERAAAEADGDDPGRDERRLWALLRGLMLLAAFTIPVAAVFGYTRLARFLATNVAFSWMLFAGLMMVHRLGRDAAALMISSQDADSGDETAADRSTGLLHFWLMAAFDALLLVVGVLALLPLWGVAWQDLQDWLLKAVQGIRIGSFTLSLTDLVAAAMLFIVILVVTRMLQRVLEERVFPQTRLDTGVRNSLKTATGYAGLVVAAGVAVSTLGLDLSELAIVLGALSVGIGFGLQNIVNNFVSGLILLVERPVKVGDWVVVGAHQGYVKRINVRATELETFQRASVIIPNSELISASLVNWTHKDTYARVEVALGVAHDADPEQVRDLLLACARRHRMVLRWPEPQVLLLAIGPSSLDLELRVFIGQADYMIIVASELRFAILRALREHGIAIAHPQLDVHLGRRLARASPGAGDDAP